MPYRDLEVSVPDSVTSLAYLAGLVDADGCISIKTSKGYHTIKIHVANTDMGMIDWLIENVGGSVHKTEKSTDEWADLYNWELYGENAAKVISAIKPFLSVKGGQAEVALEMRATKEANHQAGLPDGVLEKRKNLKGRMHELNAKGGSS